MLREELRKSLAELRYLNECDSAWKRGERPPEYKEFEASRYYLVPIAMQSTIDKFQEALVEISKGAGAFSRDPLTHADNCISHMKNTALEALTNENVH